MNLRIGYALISFFFIILFVSCDRDYVVISVRDHEWKVISSKKPGQILPEKAEGNYILKFTNDSIYSINLDVNNCGGEYNLQNDGKIFFKLAGCTEVCCDTDFAIDLLFLLKEMNSYQIMGDRLILKGDGIIKLKAQ